ELAGDFLAGAPGVAPDEDARGVRGGLLLERHGPGRRARVMVELLDAAPELLELAAIVARQEAVDLRDRNARRELGRGDQGLEGVLRQDLSLALGRLAERARRLGEGLRDRGRGADQGLPEFARGLHRERAPGGELRRVRLEPGDPALQDGGVEAGGLRLV